MAQHDYVLDNQSGAEFRQDLNNALSAIVSQNSGASAPSTTYAYMLWADTTSGQLKQRNAANNAWVVLQELDGTLLMEDGDVATPGLAFAADKNTGFYRPAADKIGIATGASSRIVIDDSGQVLFGTTSGSFDSRAVFFGDITFGTFSPTVTLAYGSADPTDDTVLGTINFTDSTGGLAGAKIQAVADANWGTYNTSRLEFHVTSTSATVDEVMRIDSSGNVGIGTTNPLFNLHVGGSGQQDILIGSTNAGGARLALDGDSNGDASGGDFAEIVHTTSGHLEIRARNPADDATMRFEVDAGEAMRIDSSGNVGIGTTSPDYELTVADTDSYVIANLKSSTTEFCGIYFGDTDAAGRGTIVYDNSADAMTFRTNGSGEDMRIDSSGRLLVGTSSASSTDNDANFPYLQLEGASGDPSRAMLRCNGGTAQYGAPILYLSRSRGSSNGAKTSVANDDMLGEVLFLGADGADDRRAASIRSFVDGTPGSGDMPGRLVFSTTADGASSPTERMRINRNGAITFGASTDVSPAYNDIAGICLDGYNHYVAFSRDSAEAVSVNRKASDGNLITLHQAGTIEGTISVSGTTVSYNGAHLARWSQLPGGVERTEILRGSVLSNIDEMCEWGEEANEQLNRMKVSDVEGDKNVAGVFQAWDDDDDTYTNDFYCAMTGDFIIRIAEGVTVERGDLLMSAGDGTAKPQDDDIIRSKTIAKVTSTNVSCTYDDGSYCVPCVLMAC